LFWVLERGGITPRAIIRKGSKKNRMRGLVRLSGVPLETRQSGEKIKNMVNLKQSTVESAGETENE